MGFKTGQQSYTGRGVLLVLAFILTGCGGSAPSLTGEEIQARNPNHTYVEIDGVALHYQQTGLGRPLILSTACSKITVSGGISPQG